MMSNNTTALFLFSFFKDQTYCSETIHWASQIQRLLVSLPGFLTDNYKCAPVSEISRNSLTGDIEKPWKRRRARENFSNFSLRAKIDDVSRRHRIDLSSNLSSLNLFESWIGERRVWRVRRGRAANSSSRCGIFVEKKRRGIYLRATRIWNSGL